MNGSGRPTPAAHHAGEVTPAPPAAGPLTLKMAVWESVNSSPASWNMTDSGVPLTQSVPSVDAVGVTKGTLGVASAGHPSPAGTFIWAGQVAQLVEHLPCKPED